MTSITRSLTVSGAALAVAAPLALGFAPAGQAQEVVGSPIEVPFDIKPQSCPNPLELKKKEETPAAILGMADLDVTDIDPDTVKLVGVKPLRFTFEDVAAPSEPFIGKSAPSDCTREGADGFTDLSLKFDNQAVVQAVQKKLGRPLETNEVVILTVTAELFDGTPIIGEDVMVVRKSD